MRVAALLAAGALLAAVPGTAQEWRLGAQLGHISYNGALATNTERPAVVLGLSRLSLGDWLGLSAGLPVAGQEFWAALGGGKRLSLMPRWGLHFDLAAHGFAQRAPDSLAGVAAPLPGPAPAVVEADGWFVRGAGAQAAAVLTAGLGRLQLEARGGVAAQASTIAGEHTRDVLPMGDARLLLDLGPVQLGPEAQQWRDDVAYAGGTLRAARGPALLWGSAGRWTGGAPDDLVWSVGGAVDLGLGIRLEGSYRSAGYDPLYLSETAGSASLGASIRMGGSAAPAAPVPAAYANGRAEIRLRARDASGTPRIAGDFTDWKPVPMTRAGDVWTVSIPLAPGVYNYAFVNERGEWFVPASVPGRRSDGMGGWQAVLVIE